MVIHVELYEDDDKGEGGGLSQFMVLKEPKIRSTITFQR